MIYVYLFTLLGAKCKIVKICLEEVHDIHIYIFIINDLYTSLLHTQYTLVYIFLLHCSNFVKVCKRMCTNHDPFFFFISRD
jgi:hypothetical protein